MKKVRLRSLCLVLVLCLTACASPRTLDSPEQGLGASSPGIGPTASATYATTAEVLSAVKAAQGTSILQDSVAAALNKTEQPKLQGAPFDCDAADGATAYRTCAYGDRNGAKLMVIYGDSHADMWASALEGVAVKNGWKLRVFALHACPGPDLQFIDFRTKAPNKECDLFHANAIAAIQSLHPALIIVTSVRSYTLADGKSNPTPAQWTEGWVSTLKMLAQPGTSLAMFGDIPSWTNSDARCLAAHVNAVQECAVPVADATPERTDPGQGPALLAAEEAAASAVGALYVPTIPWVCAERCEPVIADRRVFSDPRHLSQSYLTYLTGAVDESLRPMLTRP